MSSSSTMISLESFFGSLTAEITSKTAGLTRAKAEADQDSSTARNVDEIHKTIEEAEDILEQMELEIRGLPEADRQKCLNRWQTYKAELKRQVSQFHRTRQEMENQAKRKSLLGDELDEESFSGVQVDLKQKLLENTETVERSGRKLNQCQNLLAETENIGAAVLEDLAQQRETIQRSRNRLRDTQDDLQTSSRVLSKMTNRIVQNKLVLAFTALIVLVLVIYGIYRALK